MAGVLREGGNALDEPKMVLVNPLLRLLMEGIFQTMVFFMGLRALLGVKDKDEMSRRGKRKNKFNGKGSATEEELNNVVRKSERQKAREEKHKAKEAEHAKEAYSMYRRVEDAELPPPREAQSKPI